MRIVHFSRQNQAPFNAISGRRNRPEMAAGMERDSDGHSRSSATPGSPLPAD